MSTNPDFASTTDSVRAANYQTASWEAHERQAAPPDPGPLSDHTLHAFLHYEAPDLLLPSDARKAVEVESRCRGVSRIFKDQVTAIAVLATLGGGGVVIGWALLVP